MYSRKRKNKLKRKKMKGGFKLFGFELPSLPNVFTGKTKKDSLITESPVSPVAPVDELGDQPIKEEVSVEGPLDQPIEEEESVEGPLDQPIEEEESSKSVEEKQLNTVGGKKRKTRKKRRKRKNKGGMPKHMNTPEKNKALQALQARLSKFKIPKYSSPNERASNESVEKEMKNLGMDISPSKLEQEKKKMNKSIENLLNPKEGGKRKRKRKTKKRKKHKRRRKTKKRRKSKRR